MSLTTVIAEIRATKLELARLDPRGGMPVSPGGPAAERGVALVERRLRRALPPSYREFLGSHDGWQELYQGVTLLGVHHLSRGTYVDLARMLLDECETPVPESTVRVARATATPRRPPSAALVPFGIDARAEAVFAWNTGVSYADGELEVVVWMNEVGLRLQSFAELLELVLDMLGAELAVKRKGRGRAA